MVRLISVVSFVFYAAGLYAQITCPQPPDTTFQQFEVCHTDLYIFPDGDTAVLSEEPIIPWLDPNTAWMADTSILTSIDGCDSIVVTSLIISIANIDTDVIALFYAKVLGNILKSADAEGAYQWLDCSTGLPIPGEVYRDFYPIEYGDYAVVISRNGCVDTSECFAGQPWTGVDDLPTNHSISIYPNPAHYMVTVSGVPLWGQQIFIYNAVGSLEMVQELSSNGILYVHSMKPGMYFIRLDGGAKSYVGSFIKL